MMNLIPEKERMMMLDYIEEYALEDKTHKPIADFEHIFRFWERAKSEYLFKLFGGKLILERDCEMEEDTNNIQKEIYDKIYGSSSDEGSPRLRNFINSLIKKSKIFLIDKERDIVDDAFWAISGDLTSTYNLATNRYAGDNLSVTSPLTGKEIKFSRGCKVMKLIGKIAEAYGVEGFEEFRKTISVITTKRKIKGKFCLSIHPFDYMTMSDNNSKWSSCMSWIKEGSYRQGTVEMMNSPMVVVAYFKSDDEKDGFTPLPKSPEYRWNNKKWRELFIVNEDLITNIKAYPYERKSFSVYALEWLKELAAAAHFGNYRDKFETWESEEGPSEASIFVKSDYMYNDFESNSTHYSYFSKDKDSFYVSYSGASECMCSGEGYPDFDDYAGALAMDEVYIYERCYECNCRVALNRVQHFMNRSYCASCYSEIPEDLASGEKIPREEAIPLRFAYDDTDSLEGRKIGWSMEDLTEENIGKTVIDYPYRSLWIRKDINPVEFEEKFGSKLHIRLNVFKNPYAVIFLSEFNEKTIAALGDYRSPKDLADIFRRSYYEILV